uniref:Uncharacterized protein n=1 Tax=Lactuca sativa TaxID=4236 RepID=A0A9R1VN02_LACSA|nr:hypothetical protein LSAT_V11C400160530 [Lactuca sativa]
MGRAYFPNIYWNVVNIDVPNFFFWCYRLTTVLTLYAEMEFHKRMQKYVRWQATKIPPKIPSPLPSVTTGYFGSIKVKECQQKSKKVK